MVYDSSAPPFDEPPKLHPVSKNTNKIKIEKNLFLPIISTSPYKTKNLGNINPDLRRYNNNNITLPPNIF